MSAFRIPSRLEGILGNSRDVVDTDLSRNPRLKYWSSTLPAILPERARARLGLPVSYARTPSRNAPLNALARLILSPNPSGPHTLKVTWPCPECLEAGIGRIYYCKFTRTRTFSSSFQLAAFELKN